MSEGQATAPGPAGPWARRGPLAWWLLLGLLLAAVVVLAVYLALRQPEVAYRTVPGAGPDAGQQQRLAAERQRAETLRQEIAQLRAELAGEVCPPTAPPGTSPAGQPAAVPSPAAVPGAVPPQDPPGTQAALGQRALVDRLNRAVVLVLTQTSSASGFFVAPHYLVTNRHAVEDARDGQVLVTSKALGRVHVGRVVASTAAGPNGGPDYAVVEVSDATAGALLPLSTAYEALTPIISAGYPGLTLINDAGFKALLGGDAAAAPELVMRRGEVQAVQQSPAGAEVLVHSADILQGSSGGPIVDACGRVLGINTYITVDTHQSGKASYALSSRGLQAFLERSGVPLTVEAGACRG